MYIGHAGNSNIFAFPGFEPNAMFPTVRRTQTWTHQQPRRFSTLGSTQYNKRYYEANKEKILAQHRRTYEINKDRIAAYNKEYYNANVAKFKNYRELNFETIKEKKVFNENFEFWVWLIFGRPCIMLRTKKNIADGRSRPARS